jgi:hypothetical protein
MEQHPHMIKPGRFNSSKRAAALAIPVSWSAIVAKTDSNAFPHRSRELLFGVDVPCLFIGILGSSFLNSSFRCSMGFKWVCLLRHPSRRGSWLVNRRVLSSFRSRFSFNDDASPDFRLRAVFSLRRRWLMSQIEVRFWTRY